ncbi:thiamine phosphate synthase [Qipengyuania zhejiangensis]|uniref:thiamine phosphate synthase n=1 Tax=Qipengyuania zhejiangensis TaxID=3077782 RepID=UPI002D782300|nr:thiamine phosphate synthase [Qipengyuania sp. Z2]
MNQHQPLPLVWLLSDARNDAGLEDALVRLPKGSGFVFRHYHLPAPQRRARFAALSAIARSRNHCIVLSGDAQLARDWGADGIYGAPDALAGADGMVRLASAHDGAEIQAAADRGADGVFLSPVFPTASHPGAATLGIHGFHVLAQQSPIAVIALGGMNSARAQELDWPRWGAIDGLV